jgi:ABC-2 type transport system permease protein
MPIAQILLFGFAITNEINNVNLGILDKSNDQETIHIINRIKTSPYFKIKSMVNSERQIESIFKKGEVKAVLVFEENFGKNLKSLNRADVQIISDATDPNMANTITNYIQSIIQDYQREINLGIPAPAQIEVRSRLFYNPELKSVFNFLPGVMTVILMLVSAMMTSISITREKEQGTMEVLLVSPLKPFQVIIGKVFPYLILSIINAVLILFLGFVVFGMPVQGSYILLALETILFILCALSLGILISTISKTQQAAMMISLMGLMLPIILLSDFIFPISSMPWALQVFSDIIPAKWFNLILKGVMLKGVGIQLLWK